MAMRLKEAGCGPFLELYRILRQVLSRFIDLRFSMPDGTDSHRYYQLFKARMEEKNVSDLLRIFTILAIVYLSFRLGEEHAWRKGLQKIMTQVGEAMNEFTEKVIKPHSTE